MTKRTIINLLMHKNNMTIDKISEMLNLDPSRVRRILETAYISPDLEDEKAEVILKNLTSNTLISKKTLEILPNQRSINKAKFSKFYELTQKKEYLFNQISSDYSYSIPDDEGAPDITSLTIELDNICKQIEEVKEIPKFYI